MAWKDEDGNLRRGRPMRRQPEPEPVEKEPRKVEVAPGDVVEFESNVRWQVMDVLGWGAYMARIPYTRIPGIQNCEFYTWEKIAEKGGKKV